MGVIIMDNKIIIHENLVEIDIIDDFFHYQKICRESYYYLRSLYYELENYLFIIEKNDKIDNEIKAKIDKSKNTIKSTMDKFIDFDKKTFTHGENFVDNLKELIDFKKVLEALTFSIKLKSEIDFLQIEVLTFFIEDVIKKIELIIKGKRNLELTFLAQNKKLLLEMQTKHSCDEDRINTYKINIKNQKIRKEVKEVNFPIYLKERDYEYELCFSRERYSLFNNFLMEYLSLSTKEEIKEKDDKKNNLQMWFNIIVTISSVGSVIMSILDYIYK